MKKSSKSPNDLEQLTSQLDRLGELKPAELRERWRILFGAEPPPKLRASLLSQAVAYRIQEKALGGLTTASARLLERIADAIAARRKVSMPPKGFAQAPGPY